jgi:hypothetical protein
MKHHRSPGALYGYDKDSLYSKPRGKARKY